MGNILAPLRGGLTTDAGERSSVRAAQNSHTTQGMYEPLGAVVKPSIEVPGAAYQPAVIAVSALPARRLFPERSRRFLPVLTPDFQLYRTTSC